MSKLKGIDDGFRGKIGDYSVYKLNGYIVKRRVGVRTKPFSEKQLTYQQITVLVNSLLKKVKDFIDIGYVTEAAKVKLYPYNTASSYNRQHAIAGVYPAQYIDFNKVLFSKGDMPLTENVNVRLTGDGLEFTWNPDTAVPGLQASDQVMLMAYFPEKKYGVYVANGVRRPKGIEQLELPLSRKPVVVETYLAFISVNHKSVSNSIYTGQLIWNPLNKVNS